MEADVVRQQEAKALPHSKSSAKQLNQCSRRSGCFCDSRLTNPAVLIVGCILPIFKVLPYDDYSSLLPKPRPQPVSVPLLITAPSRPHLVNLSLFESVDGDPGFVGADCSCMCTLYADCENYGASASAPVEKAPGMSTRPHL